MRTPLILLAAFALAGGCAESPGGAASAPPPPVPWTEVAALGTTTAAGAIVGDKLGGPAGAVAGGAAGLAAGALLAHALAAPPAGPATDQARRDERLKLLQRYWTEHTGASFEEAAGPVVTAPDSPTGPLLYPAGIYNGIRFAPRTAPDADLDEPCR